MISPIRAEPLPISPGGDAQGEVTPHPSALGRHPLPTGEGREYASFSLGEKVAEERGRMRGLVIHKMFAKKTSIYDLALQSLCSSNSAALFLMIVHSL